MKRFASFLTVLLLIAFLVVPAYANDNFVPSISYKDSPDFQGELAIVDVDGNTIHDLEDSCLKVTAVSAALDKEEDDRSDEEKLLVEVYEKLCDGSMVLPFEGENADKMVIRDLMDVSLVCEEDHVEPSHVEELEKPETLIEVDFDLGVKEDVDVVVMVYFEEAWVIVEDVVNNGDGTITCLFENLCPVAFCVESEA